MSQQLAPRETFEIQAQNFIVEDAANDFSKTGEAPYAVSFHNSQIKDFTD
jgi:hypothetical protein